MGAHTNRSAHAYVDNARLSPREQREVERIVAADDAKWSGMAKDLYNATTTRLGRDVEAVTRICASGEETVDSILEDLRNGAIDATEAARAIGAARRDLNKMRRIAAEAERSEAEAWESIDCSPADYQEALMRRAPALFKGNKHHIVLPD